MSVTAIGDPGARLRLVKLVLSHFAAMHADLRGLNPKEELEVEGHPGIFKDVQVLERNEQKRAVTTVDTDDGSVEIDPTTELNRASAPAARDPEQPRVKIFVSYAHKDRRLFDVFATNLEVLKAEGLVSVWSDGQITASADWDKEIRRELEEADVIVLMVSTAFLSRSYIRGVELARAVQRRVGGSAEIGIVLLERDCSWRGERTLQLKDSEETVTFSLDAYQALLPDGRAVRQTNRHQAAFNQVEQQLRKLIAEVLRKRGPWAGR